MIITDHENSNPCLIQQGFNKNKTQNTSTGTQPTKERDIMKTLKTKHFAEKC